MTQQVTVTGREFDGLINIENSGGRAVEANNPPWRCNLRLTAGASGKPVARGRCLEIVPFRHVTGFSGIIGQTSRWIYYNNILYLPMPIDNIILIIYIPTRKYIIIYIILNCSSRHGVLYRNSHFHYKLQASRNIVLFCFSYCQSVYLLVFFCLQEECTNNYIDRYIVILLVNRMQNRCVVYETARTINTMSLSHIIYYIIYIDINLPT